MIEVRGGDDDSYTARFFAAMVRQAKPRDRETAVKLAGDVDAWRPGIFSGRYRAFFGSGTSGSRLLHLTRPAEIVTLRVNGGPDFVADRNGSPLTLAPYSRTRIGRDGGTLFKNQQTTPVIEIHIEH
jgi:hypothetical protein